MRNNGYYWIKPNAQEVQESYPIVSKDSWIIAYWDGLGWNVSGYWDYMQENYVEQVDERIIERIK